jgi:hypothetical protein
VSGGHTEIGVDLGSLFVRPKLGDAGSARGDSRPGLEPAASVLPEQERLRIAWIRIPLSRNGIQVRGTHIVLPSLSRSTVPKTTSAK